MATYTIDDKHDATIRPVDKLAPGRYQCEAVVGHTDGSLTSSSFVGTGRTAKQAEDDAKRQAREAVAAGTIKYRSPPAG